LVKSIITAGGKLIVKGGTKVAAELAKRGGIQVGKSKYVRLIVKSNLRETSFGLVYRNKRVLDIGYHEIIRGKGKMFHIRLGQNGRHRNIFGGIIK
jgi:hypothetical protein